MEMASALNVSPAELVYIRWGALLHDIGKMAISEKILNKPGSLDAEEWKLVRQHPEKAFQLLSPIEYLRPAVVIPYSHHERWDGTGYPAGLSGEAIPFAARMFAIVDVFTALCEKRSYSSAWPEGEALEYIRSESGKHFDPQLAEIFLRLQANKHRR
jgi:HD-GYP domain-containing protein (c-di-GMP phosphodiesterase class II)